MFQDSHTLKYGNSLKLHSVKSTDIKVHVQTIQIFIQKMLLRKLLNCEPYVNMKKKKTLSVKLVQLPFN